MAAFVTFEDVSKVYHSGEIEIRAVDHISFTIEKGEFCVIVGPSGAGKTTVLNMLGGSKGEPVRRICQIKAMPLSAARAIQQRLPN